MGDGSSNGEACNVAASLGAVTAPSSDAAKEREGSVARWRQLVRRGSRSGGGAAMMTTTTVTALR